MKKTTGTLLLAAILVVMLTVAAMAVSAPQRAAEFAGVAATSGTSDDGTLAVVIEESSFDTIDLTNAYLEDADTGNLIDISVTVPDESFDVVLKLTTVKKALAGVVLYQFYNPDRIRPVETPLLHKIIDDNYDTYLDESELNDSELQSNNNIAYDAGTFDDYIAYGYTTTVNAKATNTKVSDLRKKIFSRFTYYQYDTDADWYRTKLYVDYEDGQIQNQSFTKLYPETVPAYYENPNYVGPQTDILGAKGDDASGKLSFGNVYFFGTRYDDEDVIETGVVCYPTALLADEELTLDTTGALIIPITGKMSEDAEKIVYAAAIRGLAGYEDMLITARNYIKYVDDLGNNAIAYSDPIARSITISGVADYQ